MNNTAFRLFAAAVLVGLSYCAIPAVRSFLHHPMVRPPAEDINKLPMRLGKWQGEEVKLDKELFDRVGADVVVDRIYHDETDRPISAHLAVFSDPDTGVLHAPVNCYRSAGWRMLREERVEVPNTGPPNLLVDLTTWEKGDETIVVVYWYRLGNFTVFERLDLGKARWAMGGQKTWPSMIKVLLQTQAPDRYAARAVVLDMAKQIHDWISHWDVATTPNEAAK